MFKEYFREAISKIPAGSDVLELGCGNGRDALLLASKGFKVTVVDRSAKACENLLTLGREQNLISNIQIIHQNLEDFVFQKDKYRLINALNILLFLEKSRALSIVRSMKEALPAGGYVAIQCFTKDDSLFKDSPQNCFFEKDELKNLFSDFEVIFYSENVVNDKPHLNMDFPHQHNLASIIARK